MIVRLHNHSPHHFRGWKRVTVATKPPACTYLDSDGNIVATVGRQTGLETFALDVKADLAPGTGATIDLSKLSAGLPLAPVPPSPSFFGGPLTVNGRELAFVDPANPFVVDGAAWTSHLRGRIPGGFVVDVWLRRYPGERWAHAECMVTFSDPTIPNITAEAPSIVVRFGSALTVGPGIVDAEIVKEGTPFGDAQARVIPVTFLWTDPTGPVSGIAASSLHVCGVGIDTLLSDGNPIYPPGFDPLAWMRSKIGASLTRIHTWDIGAVGPAKTSGDTGAQEDQVFVRGESLLSGGVGAELIAYLGALKMANRPCHYREADGSPLAPGSHIAKPLIFWDGRPHGGLWGIVDRLGKTEQLQPAQSEGWRGPDVEHWLINTLAAAARLTGSPAIQHLLEVQAVLYPLQWTTTPGWSTTQPYASRAVGYEGINVVHLWRELSDRVLAQKTRDHWLTRWTTVIRVAPDYAQWDIVDARRDDPRLGTGDWWMPWQQAIASYGLDHAGREFNVPSAMNKGLSLALRVVEDAFYLQDGTGPWRSYKSLALDGRKDFDNIYFSFGLPMAVATVLRFGEHARARSIWTQMLAQTQTTQLSWLAPGVP